MVRVRASGLGLKGLGVQGLAVFGKAGCKHRHISEIGNRKFPLLRALDLGDDGIALLP